MSEEDITDDSPREGKRTTVLLFNQQTRNAPRLIGELFRASEIPFQKAIFCSNLTFKEQGYKHGLFPYRGANEIL
jgi:hypothetical protein